MGQSLKPVPLSKKKKKTYDLYFLIKMHKTKLNCEYVLRGEQERAVRASSNDPGYETMPSKAGVKEVRSSVKGIT